MAKLSSTSTKTYRVYGRRNRRGSHALQSVVDKTYQRKGDAIRAFNKAQESGSWKYLRIVESTPTIYASMPQRENVAEWNMPMFEVVA